MYWRSMIKLLWNFLFSILQTSFWSFTKSNLWRFFVACDYFLWTIISARECYAHQWRSQSLVADGFVKEIRVRHSVPKVRLLFRDLLDNHRLTSDLRPETQSHDWPHVLHPSSTANYKSANVTCCPSICHVSTTSSLILCSEWQTKLYCPTDTRNAVQDSITPNTNWKISPAGTTHQKYIRVKSARSSPMDKSSRYANDVALQSDRIPNQLLLSIAIWSFRKFWGRLDFTSNVHWSLLWIQKMWRMSLKRNVHNWMIMKLNNVTLQVQSKNYA